MATDIAEAHRRAFDALASSRYDNFRLLSRHFDGKPAAAIAAVSVHEPDSESETGHGTPPPPFVPATPATRFTGHGGTGA